jgi:NitT/TauT family transport system substrate-binding protein
MGRSLTSTKIHMRSTAGSGKTYYENLAMKVWTLLAAAALALSGCSPAKAPDTEASVRTIRFATDWKAQAEQGGFYQALATGEFKKRGLDVQIISGGPGVNVPQLIATGAVEMGMGSNSFVVMNLVQAKAPVRAVAAFMQKDPQVLLAHPDSGVNTLADIKGHPVLLGDASITAFWVWLKAKYGLSDDQIRKYTFNNGPFLADPRAVQQGYLTSEPYTIEKESGLKPKVMLLADEGYPGYAAMALASEDMIKSNPEAVRAFVEACQAGWRSYLFGDAKPGDALILKANPDMRQDILDQARAKMRDYRLVTSDANGRIGQMQEERWKTFFDLASGQGVYPKDLDFHRAYSLEFVAASD